MKVLLVAHNFPPHNWGGVEVYVLHFARALKRSGCEVSVLYPVLSAEPDRSVVTPGAFEDVAVCHLRLAANQARLEGEAGLSLSDPEAEEAFRAFLAASDFEVVHFHHVMRMPMSLVQVAHKVGRTVVLTLHDFWLICERMHLFISEDEPVCLGPESPEGCARCLAGPLWQGLPEDRRMTHLRYFSARMEAARTALAEADLITAPSRFVARTFERAGVADIIEIVPLGLPAIAPQRQPGPRPLTFGFIGNLQALKNPHGLLRAFAATPGAIRLEMHGGNIPALAQTISDPRVKLCDRYTPADLPRILGGLDLLIIPSLIESYCFTAREALAAGTPVLVANVGGVPEAVRHLENGILFDPRSPSELMHWLQTIADDPSVLKSLKPLPVAPTIDDDAAGWMERYRALARRKARAGDTTVAREAYLFAPRWSDPQWEAVLEEFITRFAPDDPVALLLSIDPGQVGQPMLEDARARVMQVAARTGKIRIAKVALLHPAELLAALRLFTRVRWIRAEPGAQRGAEGTLVNW